MGVWCAPLLPSSLLLAAIASSVGSRVVVEVDVDRECCLLLFDECFLGIRLRLDDVEVVVVIVWVDDIILLIILLNK